jgi:2-C-methyl-D-erythritol 4-phosphate cytidylyltransferase
MAIALILAAGRGERLGADRPKAFVRLAGRPLLQWSVDVLSRTPAIEQIVVALPPGAAGLPADVHLPPGAVCTEGGPARSQSVGRALASAPIGDPVLVHDAARPLLTSGLVTSALAAVEGEGVDAAIAACPLTDTVKQTNPEGVVTRTLDRGSLWGVQTPQVFRRAALEHALDVTDEILARATDDAWLVERAGGRVVVVEAPPENLKVTTALDLALAELLIAARDT